MLTSVDSGATPVMPSPLTGAATVPATWVPWPSWSTLAGSTQSAYSHGPSIDGMSTVKLRLSAFEKFGAMSGCVPSMPVSMIPTSTPAPRAASAGPPSLPWVPIIRMSHW